MLDPSSSAEKAKARLNCVTLNQSERLRQDSRDNLVKSSAPSG